MNSLCKKESALLQDFREKITKEVSWDHLLEAFNIPFTKRKTGILVASCIFHQEKTPSLHFWQSSGGFCCHGCDMRGDMVRFVALWLCISEDNLDDLKRSFERFRSHHIDDPRQIPFPWYEER